MQDLTSRTLGSYQLETLLGRGGMGAVYRATHLSLRQPRAIKVLAPHLAADPIFVERFQREAMIAAGLRHQNIVLIHDVGQQDTVYYIVMELVEGRALREVVQTEAPMPLPRAVGLLRQLASALDHAHSRGVLHRDVKPANVLIGSADHVTLLDFGIARAAEVARLTQRGTLIGTPEYMAPEAFVEDDVGPGADLYALGIVAYELLVGRPPFTGSSPAEIAHAQVSKSPPAPRELRPGLSPGVEGVLLRQLAKAPTERFPSAGSFVDALRGPPAPAARPDAEATLLLTRPPAGQGHSAPAVDEPPTLPPGEALVGARTDRPRPPSRSVARSRVALVGAGLVLLVAGAAYLLGRPSSPPRSPLGVAPTVSRSGPAGTAAVPTGPPSQPALAASSPAAAPAAVAVGAAPTTAATASPTPVAAAASTSPEPRPSSTPPLTLSMIFEDQFENNQRGWTNAPDRTAWLENGAYRLFGRPPIGAVAVGAPISQPLRDVVVRAAFRKVGGPPGGGYGLIVRDEGPGPRDGLNQGGRYYVLEVGDLGEYGVWRRDQDHWVDIIPWTKHAALRPGREPNDLTVRALGSRLTLIVNDAEIASIEDATLQAGGVGLYSGGDLNEVAVERFVVQVPR